MCIYIYIYRGLPRCVAYRDQGIKSRMLRGTTPFEQFPSRGLPESGLWDLGFRGSGGFRVKGAPTF